MPIYLDPIDRQLPDPVRVEDTDWHPATASTRKLWRCFEAMQKLTFLLRMMQPGQSVDAVRRFLIQFAVPADDFFVCVKDLGLIIAGDPHTRDNLTQAEQDRVKELNKRFQAGVLDNNGPLKRLRNKLGAHTDKDIDPLEAAALLGEVDIHMVGGCFHGALLACDHFTRLDCYAWSSRGYRKGETRLMTCEPYVLNFRGEECEDFIGIEQTESPKRHIYEAIATLVELSTWMFPGGRSPLVVRRQAIPPL